MKKKFKLLFILLTFWFTIHEVIIVIDGHYDEKEYSEIAVILGNKVNKDGTLSQRLRARCEAGLKIFNEKRVEIIMVSGGLGKEGHLEGTKMAEYLMSKGVPEQKIIIDNEGVNTKSTAINFVEKFKEKESVIVVTQYYHISRTKLALRKAGVKKVYGVHPDYYEWYDLYSLVREFFAYYKYLVFM